MKKLIFGIAALFMMSVVLVGCNDKKSKKDKDDEDDEERTEQVTDDEDEDADEDVSTAFHDNENLSPTEQLIGHLNDLVSLMKRTHIQSEDDVKAFADKAVKIKEKVDALMENFTEEIGNIEPATQAELMGKIEKIGKEGEKEANRLAKEAEEVGIDLSELKDLDIF
ncbi:MAG: hypothetical protein K5896_10700 [Prevotella sp.]|jgi:hypothetical protein|nr:hypothetical protein [Prevotella sp.]